MFILSCKASKRVQISRAPQNLSPHIILGWLIRGNAKFVISKLVVFEGAVLIIVIVIAKHP